MRNRIGSPVKASKEIKFDADISLMTGSTGSSIGARATSSSLRNAGRGSPEREDRKMPLMTLEELTGVAIPQAGAVSIRGKSFDVRGGILRSQALASENQTQTSEVFGYKWHQRDTFESDNARAAMRNWLRQRYGAPESMRWLERGSILVDVGCGAARSSVELFGEKLRDVRFVGTDISNAIDVAADSFRSVGLAGDFLQCDLNKLPFRESSCDVIFSEGVLHHTDFDRARLREAREANQAWWPVHVLCLSKEGSGA